MTDMQPLGVGGVGVSGTPPDSSMPTGDNPAGPTPPTQAPIELQAPADPAAQLKAEVAGPPAPAPAPTGPDLSRWNFMNPSVAISIGAQQWETLPPVTASGRPLPEFHVFAKQRAQRMGVNAIRSAADPVMEAERLFGTSPQRQFTPTSYPSGDKPSSPMVSFGGAAIPENMPGADNEASPALALMTTQPRTEAYLRVPADQDLGVAGIASVLDDGKNPIQTMPFLEALGGEYANALPNTHGEAIAGGLDPSAVLGFELSRWEFALDHLDLKGMQAEPARSAYAKLRRGDDLDEAETGDLVQAMIQFAQRMEPFSSPELTTTSPTTAIGGFNFDTGGIEFRLESWEGSTLAQLTQDEAVTRLSKVAALNPSNLVPLLADNFERFAARRGIEAAPGTVDRMAITQIGLGFSLDIDDPAVTTQIDLALNVAAARNGADPEEFAAAISAKFASEDTAGLGPVWLDGAGPGFLDSSNILDAILKPAYATGIPASGIALGVPNTMQRTTIADFTKIHTAPATKSGLVLAEGPDGNGSLLGDRDGPAETLRGAYPSGLTDSEGRQVWLNRRPSRVKDSKLGILGLNAKSNLDAVPPGARGRFYLNPPEAPVAFQPGVFIKVSMPPTAKTGAPAEQIAEVLLERLSGRGVKPAASGWEGAHREVTYEWQNPATKERLPDGTDEDVNGWERVSSETPLRDFWMELPDASMASMAEKFLAEQSEQILGPTATRAYYVNGPGEAPEGTAAQYERHTTDANGGYSVTVSGDGNPDAADTATVYVPGGLPGAGRAAEVAPFDGTGPALTFGGASASASPGVTDLKTKEDAMGLFDVTVKQNGRTRQPDHAWITFADGTAPTIKYGTNATADAVGAGMHIKVNRGGPIEVKTDQTGTVDTVAMAAAMAWLNGHGIEGRLKEYTA